MAIKCCWGCVAPKRHPGCHDHCPEYIAEKAQHDKEKAVRDQKKAIADGLTAQEVSAVFKAKKIAKRMKGRCHGK
jgi:hypothetical protein